MTYKINLAVHKFDKTYSTKLHNCEKAVFFVDISLFMVAIDTMPWNNDLQVRDQTRREIMQ